MDKKQPGPIWDFQRRALECQSVLKACFLRLYVLLLIFSEARAGSESEIPYRSRCQVLSANRPMCEVIYFTVTLYVTLRFPLLAVITAVPFFFAVTFPELFTESTSGLFDVHFIDDNLTP